MAVIVAFLVVHTESRDTTARAQEPQQQAARTPAPPPGFPGPEDSSRIEGNYQRYCALCHGADRSGYANDNAPSLKTKSLFAAGPIPLFGATAYGRPGTPMGPYLDEFGGPLSSQEIRELVIWLSLQAGVPPKPPEDELLRPVKGDVEVGAKIYAANCASCHGAKGEGGHSGTALANPAMLATTPDVFLRAAIASGREGTPMPAFGDKLSGAEIDALTAFLRTRAAGWSASAAVRQKPPEPGNYVLNPRGDFPQFSLRDDRYVSAADLHQALSTGKRMVLLDTRVPYFWAMANLPGSVPIPYYSDFDTVVANLPTDGTWIIAYCECPRAAADSVVTALRKRGFKNTAVLYEGYAGWAALGLPIAVGEVEERE